MACIQKCSEAIRGPLGIKESFDALWFPLNQAMLSPVGPIYFVLAPFFVAEITGTPISIHFIFILLILTFELSLAYPGSTAGNTVIFKTLGFSTDYIGLFSAYHVFVKNAATAYSMAFRMLEITEVAYITDNIDLTKCGKDGQGVE